MDPACAASAWLLLLYKPLPLLPHLYFLTTTTPRTLSSPFPPALPALSLFLFSNFPALTFHFLLFAFCTLTLHFSLFLPVCTPHCTAHCTAHPHLHACYTTTLSLFDSNAPSNTNMQEEEEETSSICGQNSHLLEISWEPPEPMRQWAGRWPGGRWRQAGRQWDRHVDREDYA